MQMITTSGEISQLGTIERVFRDDHVNPRLYAHLCDRLTDVADKPQIYGSVMGADRRAPGAAKLYWPLVDNIAAADRRRAQIGMPPVEADLDKFRQGAEMGPYMKPMVKGMAFTMATSTELLDEVSWRDVLPRKPISNRGKHAFPCPFESNGLLGQTMTSSCSHLFGPVEQSRLDWRKALDFSNTRF
jgi:hypothetical protein